MKFSNLIEDIEQIRCHGYCGLLNLRLGQHRIRNNAMTHPLMKRLVFLSTLLAGFSAHGQSQIYLNQAQMEQDLGQTLCSFDFDGAGVLRSAEIDGIERTDPPTYSGPTANQSLGQRLTFFQSPPFFTIETLQPGANLVFSDEEGAGSLPAFANALSIGDIDNQENDDFRVTLGAPAVAAAFVLKDNTGTSAELLHLLDADNNRIETLSLAGAGDSSAAGLFIGVISPTGFSGFEFDENPDGDDVAVGSLLFTACDGADSYEPDPTPDQGPFLEGFDFLNDNELFVEHVRNLQSPGDVDWTVFASTFNYPTSWIAAEPNTKLFVQLCQGVCDGASSASLNLQIFDFDLIESPDTAQPVFELNQCPGQPNDEQEQILPNFVDDETLFVRVSNCGTSSNVDYRIIFRRMDIGVDLHKVSGSVTMLNAAGQQVPAPAYAVIRSNYNDFTFANPADGTYAIGLIARNVQSGREIEDLQLTVTLFGAPFEASQTQAVTNMVAAESQVIDFQLGLFSNGFEDP